MSHGPVGTGLGLTGIGIGLLVFLADRLEWGTSPVADAVLILLALVLTVAGIGYVGHALLRRETQAYISEIARPAQAPAASEAAPRSGGIPPE